jgi:F-type H+-transporting ATPase subunit delta
MAELTSMIYAESLLDVTEELGTTEKVKAELDELNELFKENEDLYGFYTSPKINKEQKKETLKGILENQLSPETMNLLCVLLDKRRAMEFPGVVKQFGKLVQEKNNEVAGVVYLAKPCSDEMFQKIEAKLSEVTGKNLKLEKVIDPDLIGGIKVKIGDQIVDSTVATKLRELKGSIDSTKL